MIYRQRANRNIVSSFNSNKGRNPFGLFGMVALVLLCIGLFFLLRKPVGNILFGIRELIVPSNVGMISLDPNAIGSKVGALEIENNELKNLLIRAGVQVPGFDPQQKNIDIEPVTIDDATTTPDNSSGSSSRGMLSHAQDHIRLHGDEVIATVLVRPPQSPYDALVINIGSDEGIALGDQVYAFTGFPIGEIIDVQHSRATVRLFSSPGSKVEVYVGTSTTAVIAEGKGGGNFYLKLPKVSEIAPGDSVVRHFMPPEVFSSIESVDSTDGEAYIYAYFKLPININTLIYVLVKKNSSQ